MTFFKSCDIQTEFTSLKSKVVLCYPLSRRFFRLPTSHWGGLLWIQIHWIIYFKVSFSSIHILRSLLLSLNFATGCFLVVLTCRTGRCMWDLCAMLPVESAFAFRGRKVRKLPFDTCKQLHSIKLHNLFAGFQVFTTLHSHHHQNIHVNFSAGSDPNCLYSLGTCFFFCNSQLWWQRCIKPEDAQSSKGN